MASALAVVIFSTGANAQAPSGEASPVFSASVQPLPDSPGAVAREATSSSREDLSNADAVGGSYLADGPQKTAPKVAGHTDKYILPGQTAPHLTVHDEVVMGLKDSISPFAAVGWLASAGYEQVTNGSPNYGQTGQGFAQRLGASAARDASEDIFVTSILSPVFHEDPRYYKLGKGNPFLKRLFYAGTRPILGRTNGGRSTINFASLGGNYAGAELTQAYYPQLNRGATQVAETFGGSLGGSAIGYVVSEFLSDFLAGVHLKKGE